MFEVKALLCKQTNCFFDYSPGPCLQGYFCQGRAMEPTPQSSENFPRNGPCPVGHYCPAGCLSPVPCPFGSIRNSTGTPAIRSHRNKDLFFSCLYNMKFPIIIVTCWICITASVRSLLPGCRRCVHGELLYLSWRSLLLHWGSVQSQWPLCCWFLLPVWLLFNHSVCFSLSKGKDCLDMVFCMVVFFLFSNRLYKEQDVSPFLFPFSFSYIVCFKYLGTWKHAYSSPLFHPCSYRDTTVHRALLLPCLVQQGNTSQTQAQIAAYHVDLDFTVKKP